MPRRSKTKKPARDPRGPIVVFAHPVVLEPVPLVDVDGDLPEGEPVPEELSQPPAPPRPRPPVMVYIFPQDASSKESKAPASSGGDDSRSVLVVAGVEICKSGENLPREELERRFELAGQAMWKRLHEEGYLPLTNDVPEEENEYPVFKMPGDKEEP